MQTAENLIRATHIKAVRTLKPLKRAILGEGSMIRAFYNIRYAYTVAGAAELRRIQRILVSTRPNFWSPRWEKYKQLILLCEVCLTTGAERTYAYHQLLPLLHDESHELTREITLFLSSILP
jgi:hypothetical protein